MNLFKILKNILYLLFNMYSFNNITVNDYNRGIKI